MQRSMVEVSVGLFMLLAIAALLMLAFKVSGLNGLYKPKGFTVTADFQNIGGLKMGAGVTLAGVHIGEVTKVTLDPQTLDAIVSMQIDDRYAHTIAAPFASANIYTAGLLGANYIALLPGNVDATEKNDKNNYLHQGSRIENTQSAIILENLIGQFLYNNKNSSSDKSDKS